MCLTLPNGEVHQCNEGHTVCIDCWRRINPRACPECRQLLPQSNRCRAAERAIAALDTTCEHCGETVTRGQMEEHLNACPQRRSACAAAAAGCGWEGWASERGAHEKACPFAICLRMVEPLRSECEQLRAQNERLQRRVTALGGQGRRGSLYRGDAEEVAAATGGQDFEAMANGPPPSDAEVEEMGLTEVVAALRAHLAVARVAEEALRFRGSAVSIFVSPVVSGFVFSSGQSRWFGRALARPPPASAGVRPNRACGGDSERKKGAAQ